MVPATRARLRRNCSVTTLSTKLYDEASRLIPGGVNSPVRAWRNVGGTPLFIARANGATITDADGRTYRDFVGSWGAAIAGHAHPDVVAAVHRVARAFTGRPKVLKFAGCYHGHSDGLLARAGSGALTLGIPDSAGVPESIASTTLVAAYNSVEEVSAYLAANGDEVAAVIVEPIAANMGVV